MTVKCGAGGGLSPAIDSRQGDSLSLDGGHVDTSSSFTRQAYFPSRDTGEESFSSEERALRWGAKPQPTVEGLEDTRWLARGGPIHCFSICCLIAFAFLAAFRAHLSFLFGPLSPLRTLGPVHYFKVSSCNVRHLNAPGAQAHSHFLQICLASFALLLTVPRACEGVQSADSKLLVWGVQG